MEALLCPRNWFLGLAVFFLARTNATLFFINRLSDETLEARSYKYLLYNALPFVVFFLAFVISIFLSEGFAVNESGVVYMEKYKYFMNVIEMPVVGILFLLGVVTVLTGIILTLMNKNFKKGIWFTGVGTVVTVTMLLLVAGYNNTAFYPSSTDLQSSLTIYNASSSEFTLRAMTYASALVPVVLTYIFLTWRAMEKKKTDIQDINDDSHAY